MPYTGHCKESRWLPGSPAPQNEIDGWDKALEWGQSKKAPAWVDSLPPPLFPLCGLWVNPLSLWTWICSKSGLDSWSPKAASVFNILVICDSRDVKEEKVEDKMEMNKGKGERWPKERRLRGRNMKERGKPNTAFVESKACALTFCILNGG